MADLAVRIGHRSAQGLRSNNEDSYIVDPVHRIFMVADGMGGQEAGEKASGMATYLVPKVVSERLTLEEDARSAVQRALTVANEAIVKAGLAQPAGKRMGTTAVVALQLNGQVYVAGIGDSRAYLVRGRQVEQLTVDHSVAQALLSSGALTPEEAKSSPWQHVLHRFLGCADMQGAADVRPFTPAEGDRLVLGTDGLTNHLTDDDLRDGSRWDDPQHWTNHLVEMALKRGSRDNVTCVVVTFQKAGATPTMHAEPRVDEDATVH